MGDNVEAKQALLAAINECRRAAGIEPLAFDETALRALLVMLCAPDAPRGEVRAARMAVDRLSEAMFARNGDPYEVDAASGVVARITPREVARRLEAIARGRAATAICTRARGFLVRLHPPTPFPPSQRVARARK